MTGAAARRSTRRPGACLATALALLWTALVPAPASAAACDGVTVVVDFGALGGVRTGCAPGDPASGIAALNSAGFPHAYVPRQPGLVCQISALPSPCNGAPASAYWSYWHAPAGGSWTYSSSGAGSYDPAPGSVEGWSFGAGNPPALAPPAPPAPQPQPQPQPQQPAPPQPQLPQPAPPAAQPGSQGTTQAAPPAPDTPAPGAPTSDSSAPATAGSATPSGSAAPSEGSTPPATSPTDAPPTPIPAAQATDAPTGGAAAWPVGVLLIAALAGLGAWTARRRAAA
ncbi:hypothetical protein [Actinosynnema pretiosum]|uniref:Uncharacterized protein n=1 Tax=Actinosynnema pretiosum TaxID=42197 RepID=A0A290Z4G0_9PSEU|nr:hypothetical protein [Actinosynnema pretiosum]ATE53872.1 hypothetical protein CNX65_11675 [Actinosynnema pretiosum]